MRILLLLSISAAFCFAQRTPVIQSPEVSADGRVTFRLHAPAAQKVSVSIEGAKGTLPLQKEEQGTWSVTTDALAPDLYGYSFDVDGVHVVDPSNTAIKPNLLSLSNVVMFLEKPRCPGSRPIFRTAPSIITSTNRI